MASWTPCRAVVLTWTAAACLRGASAEDVLARMDRFAKQFNSYSVKTTVLKYNSFVDATNEQNGTFRLRRIRNGIAGVLDLTGGTDPTVIHFNGPEVEIYLPKAGEVHAWKSGKLAPFLDRMLLVGFSVGREDLKKDYDIRLGSAEKPATPPAARITLTPKSRDVLKVVTTIDLWISDEGYAVQQKILEPSGNYRLVRYSGLRVNPSLPDAAFELDLPKGVKTIKEN